MPDSTANAYPAITSRDYPGSAAGLYLLFRFGLGISEEKLSVDFAGKETEPDEICRQAWAMNG